MQLRRFSSHFAFVLVALGLNSCTCQKQEKSFHIAVAQKLGAQDPLFNLENDQLQVLSLVYEGLLRYSVGPNSELQPLLLKELPQISADQQTYTFHLKDGLSFFAQKNFSRKTPVASRDVILSLLRGLISDPGSNYSILLTGLIEGLDQWKNEPRAQGEWYGRGLPKGIQIVSPTEFHIKLLRKFPDFLSILALPAFSVVPEESIAQNARPNSLMPGTGAYYFSDTSSVDTWILRPRDEKLPVLSVVASGDHGHVKNFDIVFPSLRTSSEWLDDHLQSKNAALKVTELRPRRLEFLVFNTADAAVKKLGKDFRKNLAQVLSREQVIAALYHQYGAPQSQFIPQGIDGSLPPLPVTSPNMDQVRMSLLKALKKPLTLIYPQVGEFWVQEIRRELDFLGTNVNFESVDPAVYLDKVEKGNYQVAPISWEAEYPEATNYLQLFYRGNANSQNFSHFASPAYEELFEKLSRLFPSAERRALAEKAHKILLDEMPAIPLGFKREVVLLGDAAKSYHNLDWGFWQLKDLLSGN